MATQPSEFESREVILQKQAVSWPERARQLRVVDQQTYDQAAHEVKAIKDLQAEIEATFGPITKKQYDAWKETLAQRKKLDEPLDEAERLYKDQIGLWDDEQERKRLEKQRRDQEEADRKAAEEREQEIEDAELQGASAQEVEAIVERPLNVVPVVVQRTFQKAAGISRRDNWKANVEDLAALVKFVAQNPQYLNLVQANEVAIGAMARALKSTMNIPGIRVYNAPGVNVRR